MGNFPREELRRRLEELARSEPPLDLSSGAMCYSVAAPSEVVEYLCPVCGQKTLYALGNEPGPKSAWSRLGRFLQAGQGAERKAEAPASGGAPTRSISLTDAGWANLGLVEYGLEYCRRQVEECRAGELGITLDESQFCEQCRPGLTAPKLALVVQGERREHRVEGVTVTDVQLVAEFLEGKNKHVGDMGREVPLKEHAPRLAQLLGINPPGTEP
jgi:hypothetical protein